MLLHTAGDACVSPIHQAAAAGGRYALTGHLAGPRDMAALALLTSRDMLGPASRIRHRRDQSTPTALRRGGISGEPIERLFQPCAAEPTLLVDSEREILHTSALSEVSPDTRATAARYLHPVLGTGSGSLEPAVRGRGHLVRCRHRGPGAPGDLLHRGRVAGHGRAASAYPRLPRRPGPGVCGDHRATGSVQGALASGARAAREVLTAAG